MMCSFREKKKKSINFRLLFYLFVCAIRELLFFSHRQTKTKSILFKFSNFFKKKGRNTNQHLF